MRLISDDAMDAWKSGLQVGAIRPCVRATIQKLQVVLTPYDRAKIHGGTPRTGQGEFASMALGQASVPRELPNVRSCTWNRSQDADAADMTMTLWNTKPLKIGESPKAGFEQTFDRLGHYSFDLSSDAAADRWGTATNDWQGWIMPDRVIRTFEGRGFDPEEIPEEDPNLYLSGTWLIDEVELDPVSGLIVVRARDFARVLIEQMMFPPVVPFADYPLMWSAPKEDADGGDGTDGGTDGGDDTTPPDTSTDGVLGACYLRPRYSSDSNLLRKNGEFFSGSNGTFVPADANARSLITVGGDGSVLGHHGADAMDGSKTSYWQAAPRWTPSIDKDGNPYPFIEGTFTEPMDICGLYVLPWGGPYTCYVSLKQCGEWIGAQTFGEPALGGIPFIHKAGIPIGAAGKKFDFGRTYTNVTDIRITFSSFYSSGQRVLGSFAGQRGNSYWNLFYVGVADIQIKGNKSDPTALTPIFDPIQPSSGDFDGIISTTEPFVNYTDYCCDEETEILTKRGWLRWDEVEVGDETLAIDRETSIAGWETIVNVYRGPRRVRQMVSVESQSHSSLTTTNHKWWLQDQAGRWRWRQSDEFCTGDRISHARPVNLPTTKKYEDDFVELVAWFWTEGWWDHSKTPGAHFAQSETKNPAYVQRIRACLTRLAGPGGPRRRSARVSPDVVDEARLLRESGLTWNAVAVRLGISCGTVKSWEIAGWPAWARWSEATRASDGVISFGLGRELSIALAEVCDSEKVVSPEFLTNLTASQLETYIECSLAADGWDEESTVRSTKMAQRSERRARAFEMACLLSGRGVSTKLTSANMWSTTVLARSVTHPKAAGPTVVEVEGHVWCPTVRSGNWLARRRGTAYYTGNTEIALWLLAWGGFYWPEGATSFVTNSDGSKHTISGSGRSVPFPKGDLWGDFMMAGTAGIVDLGIEIWDQKPLMDGIRYVKDILGFYFGIAEDGSAIWRLPNYYKIGNYLFDGGSPVAGRTTDVLEIDDEVTLTGLRVVASSKNVREQIFIGNVDGSFGAVAQGFNPAPTGLRRVGGWLDSRFQDVSECQVMAELITVRQMFEYRKNSVTILANPAIQVDDQVRINERITAETYLHYVRGISSENDMSTGKWTYQLTTHWLGNSPTDRWAVNMGALSSAVKDYLNELLNGI